MSRTCIYCVSEKEDNEFSDEHIWPNALGGDFLERFWRTNDVCGSCNSVSGVFVDGAFIKGWMGNAERSSGAREYLRMEAVPVGCLPLDFLGTINDPAPPTGCAVDYWAGPCGANILHIRPSTEDNVWDTYAGGDPRAKNSKSGWAYLDLTSKAPFWVMVSLASFSAHFARTKKRIVTRGLTDAYLQPYGIEPFATDANPSHTAFIEQFKARSSAEETIKSTLATDLHTGSRMLCKVALALGCQLFGNEFSTSSYGEKLRQAFREANPEKRATLQVMGTGLIAGLNSKMNTDALAWTGAWVLMILETENHELALVVVSPSGRIMSAKITDDPDLVAITDGAYREGVVWVTIPAAKAAADAVPLPDYLSHKLAHTSHPKLSKLEELRRDPGLLPICG